MELVSLTRDSLHDRIMYQIVWKVISLSFQKQAISFRQFVIEDTPRSRKSIEIHEDKMKVLTEATRKITRKVVTKLYLSNSTH